MTAGPSSERRQSLPPPRKDRERAENVAATESETIDLTEVPVEPMTLVERCVLHSIIDEVELTADTMQARRPATVHRTKGIQMSGAEVSAGSTRSRTNGIEA